MSTAEFANSLGKTIYAIPGSISPASYSTLIAEGAQIIPTRHWALQFLYDCLVQEQMKHDKKLTPLYLLWQFQEELAWRLSENVLTVSPTGL